MPSAPAFTDELLCSGGQTTEKSECTNYEFTFTICGHDQSLRSYNKPQNYEAEESTDYGR